MSTHWAQRKERSNRFYLRFMRGAAIYLPRFILTPVLHLITLFFYLRSAQERKFSRLYLQRVFNKPVKWWHCYQHFYTFSATILDRVYFLTNRLSGFSVQADNQEVVKLLRQQPAQIWLGAHFGSLDAMRVMSSHWPEFNFRVVMKVEQNATVVELLNELNPQFHAMVIPYAGLATAFAMAEALEQKATVAILNDREIQDSQFIKVPFMGKAVAIPESAVKLALKRQLPIVQFFPIYLGAQHYRLVFTRLSTAHKTTHQVLTEYMQNLATMCQRYPYNWFNFYDYWQDEASS